MRSQSMLIHGQDMNDFKYIPKVLGKCL